MTLPRIGPSSSCVRALLAVVACWYGVGAAFAEQGATLSVTILIVDEKEVCPPDGYLNYEDGVATPRRCERLTVSDVDDWIERDVLMDEIEIPPSRIPVGRLLPFLRRYVSIVTGTIDLERRRAAVFLFEWSQPQFFELSFRRESSNPRFSDLGPLTTVMQGDRHWIHHERADSLAPGNGVVWVLATGDEEMRLRTTERPR